MAVTVKITETYDMKTTVNKMGLVSVHTPSVSILRKLYPGLLKNHRFVRFLKADVVGACASVLPADPLQVGVEGGEIAPEDMFNPILYTAVTNESFDSLVARINKLSDVSPLNSVGAGDVMPSLNADNNFKMYYSLLADESRFRKAMPQQGFAIRGLVPLAHTIISPFGNFGPQGNNYVLAEDGETPVSEPDMDVNLLNDNFVPTDTPTVFYRGKTVRMPKFPIHSTIEADDVIPYPNIPKTTVLALIVPPAKLHEFYYRVRVSWYCRFEQVCSTLEAGNVDVFTGVGGASHGTNYTYSSSKTELNVSTDTLDANDVSIDKIMES